MDPKSKDDEFYKWPFPPQLLGLGCIGGLLICTTKLAAGHSTDIATTAGIAGYVAISVGVWLGVTLATWMLLSVDRFNARMMDQLDSLEDLVHSLQGRLAGRDTETPETSSEQRSGRSQPWRRGIRIWLSIDLTGISLAFAPIPILFVLLDLGLGLFDLRIWRPVAVTFGALAVAGFVCQRFWFAVQEYRVRHLLKTAQELCQKVTSESHQVGSQDTMHLQNQAPDWDYVGPTVPGWLKKVTGIGLNEARQDSVPGTAA